MHPGKQIPEHHPVREMFRSLTERGLRQTNLSDVDIEHYLSNLLVEFIHVENLYKLRDESGRRLEYVMDMLEKVETSGGQERRDVYKHVGDFTLFVLGLFPESLSHGKRCISLSHYANRGRHSYHMVSELDDYRSNYVTFRKLSEQFEMCVCGLNWVRSYIRDPFYQFMFREFDVI